MACSRPKRSSSSPRSSASSASAGVSCSGHGRSGRSDSRPASCRAFSRRRGTCARATGRWLLRPSDLQDRRVEITGPAGDRKMVDQRLQLGRADLHVGLRGRELADLGERPRGPAQPDRRDRADDLRRERREALPPERRDRRAARASARVASDGAATWRSTGDRCPPASSTSACTSHRNAGRLLERGTGPYFYLPKLESHLEARLWNDVFVLAQDRLGLPQGTIKATVLIETILAAFEMEEILYELREHSAGLNAGRWDYIFSAIKKFRDREDFVLPDRVQVTMAVPFMRSYTELLVRTCHKRGAHAIGGMAAFIPSRRDPEVNERALTRVREDKLRESGDGFDGTWVAHPDLVPVAAEVFDAALGERPNQLERLREDVSVDAADLLNVSATPGDDHRGRRAGERLGRYPLSRLVALRHGRRRDRQPHGGRGHRGDLALADLAMGSARPGRSRRRRARDRGGRGGAAGRARDRRGAGSLRAGRARRGIRGVPHAARVRAPAGAGATT